MAMKSQSFPVKFVDNQTNLSQFKDKINRNFCCEIHNTKKRWREI